MEIDVRNIINVRMTMLYAMTTTMLVMILGH